MQPVGVLFNGRLSAGRSLDWSLSEAEPMPLTELSITDSFAPTRRRFQPVEIFSEARQKIRHRAYFHHVRQRFNPEGSTLAVSIDIASIFILPVAQALIAINLNTGIDITDPKLAVATALTGISVIAARYSLSKKGCDISAVGCIAQAITGKPTLSAIAEHAINYIGPFNLVNIGALVTGNLPFIVKNITAAPFVLAPWCIAMNTLIGHGQADRVLNPIRKIEDATWGKITDRISR
jgi:hypothetical protein